MSKKIKNEQKKFLGETLNQYDKALNEGINQLDKKNREQNHKISSLVNSFDNEYLEKDVEGNMTTLENSKDGMVIINEIQGSTEVNYCKDGEKELILNGDIDTQGESFVTITEGVDGGLVDVSLEGNTEINLSKTKDPVLVTREFDDINCNTGKLQYTIDDVTTINDEPGKVDIDRIVGDTMVNHAVNGSEELILNAHIDESGDNNITLNGVTSDGGKVDVALEGNTLVNVSKTKDDYITPSIEDKVDQGSVISLPEVSEGLIHIDEIEGNTLVNYCTDGAKELTLNGDIDVKGTFVTTTEGVDNGLVDVALEGNTLVNLIDKFNDSISPQGAYTTTNKGFTLTKNHDGGITYFRYKLKYALDKSKKYTIIYDIVKNTLTNTDPNFGIYTDGVYGAMGSTTTTGGSADGKLGRIISVHDVKASDENLEFLSIGIHQGDAGGKLVVDNLMLLEGDWTDKEIPQYFEGMKSVGQDDEDGHKVEIASQNKNLIDPSKVVKDKSIDSQTGEVFDTSSSYALVDYVPIKPNMSLIYSATKVGTESNPINGTLFHFYDINKKHIHSCYLLSTGLLPSSVINGKTPSNAYYLRISYGINDGWGTSYETLLTGQLEYGTTKTDYIPHAKNKKEILLNEPLRSLPNGVKDRFVKIGGKWFVERNCMKLTFNGSESIWSATGYGGHETRNTFEIYISPRIHNKPGVLKSICDTFIVEETESIPINDNAYRIVNDIGLNDGTYFLFTPSTSIVPYRDIDAWKEWLSVNPITIIVECSPTYEPLEIEPTLNTYNDTTHLSNNSIIPCNMQIKNTGYNCILKPSTLYTVAVDTNESRTIGINLGGAEATITDNVATITTPLTLTDDSLRLHGKGIKASRVRLLEGDKTNWIPSFFEGMKSSFEDKVQTDGSYKMEILSKNKNLLDLTDIVYKGIGVGCTLDACSTELIQYTNNQEEWTQIFFMMKLKPFTEYTLSAELQSMNVYVFNDRVRTWDTGKYIGCMKNTTNTLKKNQFSFTTNKTGCVSIRFTNERMLGVNIAKNIMLSEVAGDYIEPKSNKVQLSSIEPLRGVGDVHDRLVFKDGKLMVERNCIKLVLDGIDEVWNYEVNEFFYRVTNHKPNGSIVSDKIPYGETRLSTAPNNHYCIKLGANYGIVIRNDNISSPSEFKQWLKANPVTVVYELETPTYEEIPYDLQKIILESYNNGTLFIDTNIPPTKVSFNCFEEELTYLYPATSYTVQFTSDRVTTVDVNLGGTSLLAQSITRGVNRISITTPETLVNNKLIIDGVGASISNVVVTDTDREFKYFEGMKSVGECEELEVLSNNKNLFDMNDLLNYLSENNEYGSYEQNGDGYNISCNRASTDLYTNFKPNTRYTLKIKCSPLEGFSLTQFMFIYDDGTVQYSGVSDTLSDKVIMSFPNKTIKSFKLTKASGLSKSYFEYIQLEEGSTATDYIPHQSNSQQLTHEPLRSVGNTKDRYVLIDNKWYIERRCGEYIITDVSGNEWNILEYSTGSFLNGNPRNYSHKPNSECICDKLKSLPISTNNIPDFNAISSALNGEKQWRIKIINCETKEDYIEWISKNPLKVIAELPSPQYEPINYNPLEVYSDVTHITTNSAIPTNITIKNHGYNLVALKENTQYTLYVNKDTTNALTYRLGDYVEINSPSKFTFTTPSTLTDKTLRIDGKGAKVNDLMLIEGTPANDPVGYFDGLKSSYECERVPVNLVNNITYATDRYNLISNANNNMNLIKDCYLYNPNNLTIRVAFGKLSDLTTGIKTQDYSTSSVIKLNGNEYIRYVQHIATQSNENMSLLNNIIIVEGDYTDYDFSNYAETEGKYKAEVIVKCLDDESFESKQTVYLNSPLLKGDEIVWKDNKIQHYHKMKTIVLDGSDDEEWRRQPELDNDTTERYWIEKINNNQLLDVKINTISYNDKFDNIAKNNTCLYTHPTNARVDLRRLKTDNRWTDLNSLKQWLQANPVTVVYELETPYYEEISDYPLKLNVIANSSLSTESTIQVTNISFNIYEETLPYLYPNTKYYITFNADVDRNNIIINLGGNYVVFDCKVGFNKVEITTPSDTTNLLTFSGTGVNIDHVKVTQQDIDEYFEGMKSVGECEELEITSANSDNSLSNAQQLTHEPLRAVGNVKDKYVLLDGKWHIERNTYKYKITKDTKFFIQSDSLENYDILAINTSNFPLHPTNEKPLCDKFLPQYANWNILHNEEIECIQTYNNDRIFIKVLSSRLPKVYDNAMDNFKEWLTNNEFNVIYPVASPTYEPIDYNPLVTYADVTHISTNSLIPTNMVIKNHGHNCILKPSTKYTIALNKPNGTISAKLGGSAKVDSTNSIFTITTPSTLSDNVLRLSGSGNIKDIMILEGDKTVNTPSYFEGIESVFEQEYDEEKGKYRVTAKVVGDGKESTITFYINEPLRGTDTAKDKVFIQDGKVVVERNCGSAIFDGSERIQIANINDKTIEYFLPNSINKTINNMACICNTISYGSYGVNERITTYETGVYITINKNKLNTQDIPGFKQWLSENPTTVVYALLEPVYEEADCDLSKLVLENYENSSLIFESNIPVSANIRYSGEVPVVTQAKALSSKVDNTTFDINENIIPYMCDIDYRIVELQLMNGDSQGEGIELLGIGDIEILGNENVLFNNREDKKYNYSYDMLKRDILSKRYSREEYQYRLDRYLLANKISDEEYKELEGLLNNGK